MLRRGDLAIGEGDFSLLPSGDLLFPSLLMMLARLLLIVYLLKLRLGQKDAGGALWSWEWPEGKSLSEKRLSMLFMT